MASSSMLPGKITLHSTSKIPLSERFKMVQQTALIKKNIEPVVRPSRVSVKPLARGSWKNRQLAASLANKPSVRAALKIKKKSIKQRLSVKPKPVRGSIPGLVNRTFSSSKKSTKKSIIERLQVAPSTSGNARRPKLNRSNFVGLTKVAPKNVRRVSRRQGGNTSALNNNNAGNRRPVANRFNNNNNNKANNKQNNNNNQGNRPLRQGTANIASRRNQQRLNQHMKNRRLTPNNNNFNGNQQRQPQRQRQFNRRNNNQQGKSGPQGARARGGFKQDQGNRNVNNKRFQNRRPNNRQNQQRKKNPDYIAKTRNQLDADLDAYMAAT